MPALAQRLRERLRLGGQHLAHAERRHERARERRLGGQVGDVLVEHPRVEAAGDLADQPRPDHGAIGLVQEGAERASRLVLGIRRRRQLVRARRGG